jgi:hypothetical protein
VTRRALLFVSWALLGMVASYGAIYAFSPYGIVILAVCGLVAWTLPKGLEAIGAAAGPGLFCWLVAWSAESPAAWFGVGAAIVATALGAYALTGRARCGRAA